MHGSTIVVATDLSDHAGSAARWAADVGRLTGLPVVVAHVVEMGLDTSPWRRYAVALDTAKAEAAESEVARWFEAQTGERPSGVEVRVGACVPTLEAIARESRAGLMVVSRTGKGALSRALLGSRVQRLATRPPCPLAVVNPLEERVEKDRFRVGAATDFDAPGDEAVAFARLQRSHIQGSHFGRPLFEGLKRLCHHAVAYVEHGLLEGCLRVLWV